MFKNFDIIFYPPSYPRSSYKKGVGGVEVNERHLEALAQYDLVADNVRKGRSGWICETSQGTMLLQEYRGTMKRLEFETQVLGQVRDSGLLQVDDYIRTKGGELISLSEDGTRHTLKHWYTGRECNIKDFKEILQAVTKIALLHQVLRKIPTQEEWNLGSIVVETAGQEMERHTQELKRARNFMKSKRKKTDFERCALSNFSQFFEQAQEAAKGMERLSKNYEVLPPFLCHGDLDQHHIQILSEAHELGGSRMAVCSYGEDRQTERNESEKGETLSEKNRLQSDRTGTQNSGAAVIEYHKMHLGDQMTDLYHFMRKIMEKHGWDQELGIDMLTAYDHVTPLTDRDRESLYYLFLYPEKYWKQINFYMNSNKVWIPARNLDKLKNLEEQTEQRNRFLSVIK